MKYLKRYEPFLEAFQAKDKYSAITKIVEHIKSSTGYKLFPYYETIHIKKETINLEGQLYLALDDNLAIRFNWDNSDKRSELHSIDLWKNFEFDIKPDFTLNLNNNSVIPVLKDVISFINNPEKMLIETEKEVTEDELALTEDLEEEFGANLEKTADSNDKPLNLLQKRKEELEKKHNRARKPETKQLYKEQIEKLEVLIAQDEHTETNSTETVKSDIKDDIKLNVFRAIELNTIQVAKGKSNSLLVTGRGGIGKTATVLETLSSLGLYEGAAYEKYTGDISTAGLYQALFINRHKLLLFDDCDSVLEDDDSINMLKGVLDTYPKRTVANAKRGHTYYDSTNMSDTDIQVKYEADSNKLPNKFTFDGKVIFITNKFADDMLKNKKLSPLLTRTLLVDVKLTREEVIERMRVLIHKVVPDESINKKFEALEYLEFLSKNHALKTEIDLRSLVHAVNIRCNPENEVDETIGNQKMPVWKLLIKQHMVR